MSEEIIQTETTEEVETETVASSVEDVKTNETTEEVETNSTEPIDQEEEKYIPYNRFKTINDKYKEMKAELELLKADPSQQTNEATTENTEVIEEKQVSQTDLNNPLQEKVTQYEVVFQSIFTTKMEQVPESFRDLIPEGDDISKLAWIDAAISKGLFTNNKPQDFGGLGANPTKEKAPDSSAFIRGLGRKFD